MSEPRMSTAICHLLLAGSSAWTCRTLHTAGHIQWAYGTLGLYFAKSVVGVLRYGIADPSKTHRSLHDVLEFSSLSLGLPLVVTDVYMSLKYPYLASLTHAVGGFLPILTLKICSNILSFEILELELFGSIVSFGYVGLRNRNMWAVAAAFCYAFSYYGLCGYHRENHEPFLCDLYLVGLSLFNIFACIPLITTDLYMHHGYPPEGAFIHAALGFLPLVGMFVRSDPNVVGAALNTILFGCTISMIAMGFVNSNYWAVGGGFWYMLIYDFKPSVQYRNFDSLNMYTLGLCLFNYFVCYGLMSPV